MPLERWRVGMGHACVEHWRAPTPRLPKKRIRPHLRKRIRPTWRNAIFSSPSKFELAQIITCRLTVPENFKEMLISCTLLGRSDFQVQGASWPANLSRRSVCCRCHEEGVSGCPNTLPSCRRHSYLSEHMRVWPHTLAAEYARIQQTTPKSQQARPQFHVFRKLIKMRTLLLPRWLRKIVFQASPGPAPC
jgi:hypothetical protein